MKINPPVFAFLGIWIIVLVPTISAGDRWQSGLGHGGTSQAKADSVMSHENVLSFDEVLDLVAAYNPLLRSLEFKKEAVENRLMQAGLWNNPKFSSEFEEIGWDAAGFSESEISLSLSQEFEIFGQRNARKNVAATDVRSTNYDTKLQTFDLYVEVRNRFNKLLHAQRQAALADSSVRLAEDIVEGLEYRMKRGVALQSEILLAELELQRVSLTGEKARQELFSAQIELMALWNSTSTVITVSASEEPDLESAYKKLSMLTQEVDSTRLVQRIHYANERTRAEVRLAATAAKPGLTLDGGYKRLNADNSNSFLFGLSFPVPFLNRNQGEIAALKATIRSQEYEQERVRIETRAYINSTIAQLDQLIRGHMTLDTLLLPTAEHAYSTLQEAHNVGRIPYTTLLEAERSLIQLRFEHNDILFAIHEQLIALEQISGIRMYE